MATTEVTVNQLKAFKTYYDRDTRYFADDNCPAGSISWYEALQYCNWLSDQAGIQREEWCYPEGVGPGSTLPTFSVSHARRVAMASRPRSVSS